MQPAIERPGGQSGEQRTELQRLEKQHMHAEHTWPGEATRGAASKTKPDQANAPALQARGDMLRELRLQSQLLELLKNLQAQALDAARRRTS